MIVAVFIRRLRDGVTFENFISAWEADKGFGVPARVLNATAFDDEREILSIGFVDIDPSEFASAVATVAEQEAVRHSRIDEVVDSTVLRGFFDLRSEHDFSGSPRRIDPHSPESLLAALDEWRRAKESPDDAR
jgi:hypothetical protein